MTSFTQLEKTALDAILAELSEGCAAVEHQLLHTKVVARENTGGGFFSDLEVDVLSKDSAVVLGSWALAREKDNPKGKFTLIFKRFKDGWKIVHDHTS